MKNPFVNGVLFETAGEGAGAGGGTGAFDPAVFRTELRNELMSEFRKDLNGILKKLPGELSKEFIKAQKEAADAAAAGAGTGEGSGAGEGAGAGAGAVAGEKKISDPAINAQLQALSRRVEQAEKKSVDLEKERDSERQNRLETERLSMIRTEIGALPTFRNESLKQMFFDANHGRIKRDEEGNLIAETDKGPLPMKDFLRTQAESSPELFIPKGSGGSGANKGNGAGFSPSRVAIALSNGEMSTEEFAKLEPGQKTQAWNEMMSSGKT